ncbi:MAG: 50S ribosomal protein L32e [Thermoproteales archaeon]|nr:50S ribosomal protein L32e [Thermoproteales archaeon]
MSENIKLKPRLTRQEKRLLKVRRLLKSKKPFFTRINSWFLKRIDEDVWRHPRGLDNKIKHEIKGYPARVKIGYRGPRSIRGIHPSGFEEVLVYSPKDLEKIDKRRQAIRIASTVGRRKRREIIEKANNLGIKILNPSIGGELE